MKYMFVFLSFCNPLHGKGSWNPSSWKTQICLFCLLSNMVADILALHEVMTSAVRVLTILVCSKQRLKNQTIKYVSINVFLKEDI